MSARAPRLVLLTALALLGACKDPCEREDTEAPELRLEDPSRGPLTDFFAHPWPSDARLRSSGTIEVSTFPNPTASSTLEDYLQVIGAETQAYSTVAPIYMSFTAPIDPESLPGDPLASLEAGSTLELINIDARSPEAGRRHPVRHRTSDAATLYLPENHLIVAPPFGIPLAPDTTYALVARRGLRARDGRAFEASRDLHAALRARCEDVAPPGLRAMFAPLRAFFDRAGASGAGPGEAAADEVVAATVFTTQGALREMRQLADVARALPGLQLTELERVEVRDDVILFRGVVELPGFQRGHPPYMGIGDGGGLARDDRGVPVVDHRERTRVGLSIPRRRPDRAPGAAGWPVVLYAHGTGGSHASTFDPRVAEVLGRRGLAVVGFDQTLHGPRDPTGSDPDLTFFNLFNPIAARDNVRQGAADLVMMTSLLASGLVLPASLTGEAEARLDPERIAFFGHSQGSLVGAPFVAVEPRVRAFVFSGLGAILTITLLERKDIVDFKGLFESLLALPPGEALDELHPVLSLLQTFIEAADPISYAKSYLADPPAGALRDILHVEGLLDFASPARGQEAFAVAARIPLIAPEVRVPPAALLVGPAPEHAPALGNVESPVGRVTYGLIQYPDETHFPVFRNADASARFAEFLWTALHEGRGRIIPAVR